MTIENLGRSRLRSDLQLLLGAPKLTLCYHRM
jgi:hypothetical protein